MKWEYRCFRYTETIGEHYGIPDRDTKTTSRSDYTEACFNAAGEDGWELVGFEDRWIFKRPKTDGDLTM